MQFFSVLAIVPCLALQVASIPLGSKDNHDTSPSGHSHQLQRRSPGVAVKGLASFSLKKIGSTALKVLGSDARLRSKATNFVKNTPGKENRDQNKANTQYSNSPLSNKAIHYLPKQGDVGGKNSGVNFAKEAAQRYGKVSGIKQ
ncbi:hypothetical protein DSO57_1002684 [Entomophthora muscae]|uniref:Uncharacterized protein n=1 Tax=Entomophthora muscae TaxID=34485 RepID=A0ACC2UI14_9FUNG|nr:hypothetical protein DSO57_1002684 [Entomophthora muscae]